MAAGVAKPVCGPERPEVKDAIVAKVLKEYYGLELKSVAKLPGYDDFTALVKYTRLYEGNALCAEVERAVLKILGTDSSSKSSYQMFIGSMLNFLASEGLPVSVPIKQVDGSVTSPSIQLSHQERISSSPFPISRVWHRSLYCGQSPVTDVSTPQQLVSDYIIVELVTRLAISKGPISPNYLQHVAPTYSSGCQGHFVHLLSYIEGATLQSLPYEIPGKFLTDLGATLAKFHSAVQQYAGCLPEKRPSPWHLVDAAMLNPRLNEIELEANDYRLVNKAIADFTSYLLDHATAFRRCLLHGDVNEANIIIKEDNSNKNVQLAGLIDFGEMVEGPVVVDLAILIISIVHSNNAHIAELVRVTSVLLQGYRASNITLGKQDLELLFYALPARCAQYIIMCKSDALRDPDNAEYILSDVEGSLISIREIYSVFNNVSEFINKLCGG